jgi:hypothetical protein
MYDDLIVPADFWVPQFTAAVTSVGADVTGNLTLTPVGGGTAITFGSSSYYGGGMWTFYNNSGSIIPQGTYNVTVTFNNANMSAAETVSVTGFQFLTSRWALYQLSDLTSDTPAISRVANGYGQANTPVSYDNLGNIYFGIYEGDRSYYQVSTSGTVFTGAKFTPTNGDDFYYAGAVVVTVTAANDTIVFGSDSGTVYALSTSTFTEISSSPIALTPTPGQIRSTMVAPSSGTGNGSIFFTSKGSGTNGYLWSLNIGSLGNTATFNSTAVRFSTTSVSTPVISNNIAVSNNNLLYIGASEYNSSTFASIGSVQAFDTSLALVAFIYGDPSVATGDPVQASPIVYSDVGDEIDYIYFTTNSSSGKGYAYSYTPGATSGIALWNSGGTSSNPYAVQGFASDGGYLVYGDDGNFLYIMH